MDERNQTRLDGFLNLAHPCPVISNCRASFGRIGKRRQNHCKSLIQLDICKHHEHATKPHQQAISPRPGQAADFPAAMVNKTQHGIS
ncbi:MAG: hypothetical protein IIA02_00425 [Proteobacteria bacterium]|nr:hypothetical protein [Pseudomonadota bacterium]